MIDKFSSNSLHDIFKIENILLSYKEFLRGKSNKPDVSFFTMKLYKNLKEINEEILSGNYTHGKYETFVLMDTKKRRIHKATVKDRIIHHNLFKFLYPYFEKVFIYQSFSCRVNKGPIKACDLFSKYIRKVSKNNTKQVHVLKLDIRKCFANVDQEILKRLLVKYISEVDLLKVLNEIIDSFQLEIPKKGIPLGNVTSQLFINIYLHELDEFVKRTLKVKWYIRYADDFVILENSKTILEGYKIEIEKFLTNGLKFEIKKQNTYIQTLSSGVTFLGTTFLPKYKIISKRNRRRFLNKVSENNLHSYLGFLKPVKGKKLEEQLIKKVESISIK